MKLSRSKSASWCTQLNAFLWSTQASKNPCWNSSRISTSTLSTRIWSVFYLPGMNPDCSFIYVSANGSKYAQAKNGHAPCLTTWSAYSHYRCLTPDRTLSLSREGHPAPSSRQEDGLRMPNNNHPLSLFIKVLHYCYTPVVPTHPST